MARNIEELKGIKNECLDEIREYMKGEGRELLAQGDSRLTEYILDCVREDIDAVNIYELLGVRKFLRMAKTYPMDWKKAAMVLRAYEGEWSQAPSNSPDEGENLGHAERGEHEASPVLNEASPVLGEAAAVYVEGSGGLLFSGMSGKTHYRLTPLQVFELVPVFGLMRSESDWRRVITEANYFIPRKSSKTTLAAFYQFMFFFFEDANAEAYCCANSQDQSKILFNLTWDLIHQLDPNEKRIRFTAKEIEWKPGQMREAKVSALSAGGKTKDGLFAQLCCADEFGSASYVNEKSDMANLVNVVRGSMGPRREPLTVITTTAGRITAGPYKDKLAGIENELLKEMEVPLGEAMKLENDWQYALLCQPDEWERDDESLMKSYVWRKVNRHIGVTVQPDYYENEWKQMKLDQEYRKEQVTKLFNVWQTDKVTDWIGGDEIRRLQSEVRVDDLTAEDGWIVFVGCDFSKGDDLNAVSYLCYNQERGEFFADMDAWICEETLNNNTNSGLYRLWYEKGWLRVSPGKTIDENLVLNRLMELSEHVNIMKIGYDAYDSKRFVNAFSAWIYSLGEDPKNYITPVRQNFASYNPVVNEMDYMIKSDPAMIKFSGNPMWSWEFSNCILAESSDGMENRKPLKRSENEKVDNVQALLSALMMFDMVDGEPSPL